MLGIKLYQFAATPFLSCHNPAGVSVCRLVLAQSLVLVDLFLFKTDASPYCHNDDLYRVQGWRNWCWIDDV